MFYCDFQGGHFGDPGNVVVRPTQDIRMNKHLTDVRNFVDTLNNMVSNNRVVNLLFHKCELADDTA